MGQLFYFVIFLSKTQKRTFEQKYDYSLTTKMLGIKAWEVNLIDEYLGYREQTRVTLSYVLLYRDLTWCSIELRNLKLYWNFIITHL